MNTKMINQGTEMDQSKMKTKKRRRRNRNYWGLKTVLAAGSLTAVLLGTQTLASQERYAADLNVQVPISTFRQFDNVPAAAFTNSERMLLEDLKPIPQVQIIARPVARSRASV